MTSRLRAPAVLGVVVLGMVALFKGQCASIDSTDVRPAFINWVGKFVQLPPALAESALKEYGVTNNADGRFIGALSDSQAKDLLKRFEQEPLARSHDMQEIGVNIGNPMKWWRAGELLEPGVQNQPNHIALELTTQVLTNSYSIRLIATSAVKVFDGLETYPYTNGFNQIGWETTAKFQSGRIVTNSVVLSDGQVFVLGTLVDRRVTVPEPQFISKMYTITKNGIVGQMYTNVPIQSTGSQSSTKENQTQRPVRMINLVFATPTLLDSAGNHIHTDEEISAGRNATLEKK